MVRTPVACGASSQATDTTMQNTNTVQDPNSPITLRTRKFITNRLLQRRQMVLDVIHPARPNVSRNELQEKLGEMYKAPKEQCFVFGMRTHYGGGRSTGFALIYDSPESLKLESKFRLVRVRTSLTIVLIQNGIEPKIEKPSRKLRKERKKYVLLVLKRTHTNHLQPCQEGPRHQEDQGHRVQEEVMMYTPSWISSAWAAPVLQPTSPLLCIFFHTLIPSGIEKAGF